MGSVFYEKTEKAAFFYEDTDITFPPHIHSQVEVFYLLEGQVRLLLGKKQHKISAGEIVIIFPGMIHSYESIGMSRFYIGLSEPDKLGGNQSVFKEYCCMNPVNKITCFNQELLHVMKVMAEQNTKNTSCEREERLYGYFSIMLDYMLEVLECVRQQHGNDSDILPDVLQYIINHSEEKISLEQVAHHIGISKYYLSKLFSGKLFCSFPDYLIQIRVEHAKELLRRTDKKMIEIADICGFQSETSFFRNFKKITDTTPLQYRKR